MNQFVQKFVESIKAEGILRHRTASLRLVGSGGVKFGLRFGFADSKSQDQAKTPLEPMCDRSLGNLQGVSNPLPRPRSQDSSPHPRRSPCAGCATGASVNVNGLRVTCLMRRARCLLFDSHMGHTMVPTWADTHSYTHTYTRTAICRALGSIGVRTDVPALAHTLLSSKNGWKPQYDGAYPRREQAWDCACTIYNSHVTIMS